MIVGTVDESGLPIVLLTVGEAKWAAIVDTGFNGDLEIPDFFRSAFDPIFVHRVRSILAGGQSVEEDLFTINIPFDGKMIEAEATFTPELLTPIGTRFLRDYHLEIDFVACTLILSRSDQVGT